MLSIVCPIYNEASNIDAQLDAIDAAITMSCELIFVYDMEEDTTLPRIMERRSTYRHTIRLMRNAHGAGALNAIKTGIAAASNSTAVLVIMADLSDDLAIAPEMYKRIATGTCDVVCGSRYMRGGQQIGGPLFKGLLSRFAGVSLYLLAGLGTHDATNNFKMYRGSFLRSVQIESVAGFEIALELVAKAHVQGYRVCEIPSTWRDRSAGTSRFRLWHWLPNYIRWYLYAFGRRKVDSP